MTSLVMIVDVIGNHNESSGFVYSAMNILDKILVGVVVAIVQTAKPVAYEVAG